MTTTPTDNAALDNFSNKRTTTAFLWMQSGYNSYGEEVLAAMVEIKVRLRKGLSETLDSQGNKIASDLALNVDREITIGSIIWIGNHYPPADDCPPGAESDFFQVIDYKQSQNVKGTKYHRRVELIRHSRELPDLV